MIRRHIPLELELTDERPVLQGTKRQITATMTECDRTIEWSLDVLPHEEASRSKGWVSRNGTYTPPDTIERSFEVVVVATPRQHPYEAKTVKLTVGRTPDSVKRHEVKLTDENQEEASFIIQVLDKTCSWEYTKLSLKGGVTGASFVRELTEQGIFSGFEKIFCIGAASREYTTKEEEENRARDRAGLLAWWVQQAVGEGGPEVTGLKVGRYNSEQKLSPEETSIERQVVFVGVVGHGQGADLTAALRRAFAAKRAAEPILGMYLDYYPSSQWQLTPPKLPDK